MGWNWWETAVVHAICAPRGWCESDVSKPSGWGGEADSIFWKRRSLTFCLDVICDRCSCTVADRWSSTVLTPMKIANRKWKGSQEWPLNSVLAKFAKTDSGSLPLNEIHQLFDAICISSHFKLFLWARLQFYLNLEKDLSGLRISWRYFHWVH